MSGSAPRWTGSPAESVGVLGLQDRPLTVDEARLIAARAHPPPFDLYELTSDVAVDLLTARDPAGHYPVVDGGRAVGFAWRRTG